MPPDDDFPPPNAECWVLHDGAAGNRRQAVALADAMGLRWHEIVLRPALRARLLAPRRAPSARESLGEPFARALRAGPPKIAIGCGRIAALATRLAREAGAQTVQILDPRLPTRHWDVVVAPEHDGRVADNLISLQGSLHPVDDAWLQAARQRWPEVGHLPQPRTALLVGGPTPAVRYGRFDLESALRTLRTSVSAEGGSLLTCAAPRTPTDWMPFLREHLGGLPGRRWLGPADGDNLYPAALAWADRIVVTADSANMLSEACATRVPVQVIAADAARGRLGRFVARLRESGRVQGFGEDWPGAGTPETTPLRETARLAVQVRQRLRLD